MKHMRQSLLLLVMGLGMASLLVSCDQPTQPDGQVEIPSENTEQEAPNALGEQDPSEAPPDLTAPDPDALGGPSDLPPIDAEPVAPDAQAAPDLLEAPGEAEVPQDSELPLITEPDPSEAAPPAQ